MRIIAGSIFLCFFQCFTLSCKENVALIRSPGLRRVHKQNATFGRDVGTNILRPPPELNQSKSINPLALLADKRRFHVCSSCDLLAAASSSSMIGSTSQSCYACFIAGTIVAKPCLYRSCSCSQYVQISNIRHQ